MAWTEVVTIRDGVDKRCHGGEWLVQRLSRLEMAWTEKVMVRHGLDRDGLC